MSQPSTPKPLSFPGLVDLQVNGFAGVDFNRPGVSPEQVGEALAVMRGTGVTACLPTLITSSAESFAACARAILACGDPANVGIHMEGPYISPVDGARGAHPLRHVMAASVDDFRRRQESAGGRIRMVTLAPEVPGALALIETIAAEGVVVAIGHTAATAAQIEDAVRAGARLSTHLGNGCPQMIHRHDNVLWPQLAAEGLSASLIVDGHHLPPQVVKAMLRAKGADRCILVSDATAAAAAPAGNYSLGEEGIERAESGRVSKPGSPYLAGSSLTMDQALANMARFCALPIEEVIPLASSQPARIMGIEPRGRVEAVWDASAGSLRITGVLS